MGRHLVSLWVVLLVGLLVSGAPERAEACGACICSTPSRILPARLSSTTLPLNARFLVELQSFDAVGKETRLPPGSVRWTEDDSQTSVEFETVDSGNGHQFWIIPNAPLSAETNYTLELHNGDFTVATESFRTGTAEDHIPPSAAELETDPPSDHGECPHHALNLSWASMDDEGRPLDYSPIVEVSVQKEDETALLFVDASEEKGHRKSLLATSGLPEAGSCWGSALLPFAPNEEPLVVTAAIYDSAGNRLSFAPLSTQLTQQDSGGCPGGPSCSWTARPGSHGPLGWLSFGLVGLALMLRSSPSSSASTK